MHWMLAVGLIVVFILVWSLVGVALKNAQRMTPPLPDYSTDRDFGDEHNSSPDNI